MEIKAPGTTGEAKRLWASVKGKLVEGGFVEEVRCR
jgi:hypothetical protein